MTRHWRRAPGGAVNRINHHLTLYNPTKMAAGGFKNSIKAVANLSRQAFVETWARYRRLGWVGKGFIWFLILVHVALIAVLVRAGPAKVFQTMYVAPLVILSHDIANGLA